MLRIIEIELDKINKIHLFCARDGEKVMNGGRLYSVYNAHGGIKNTDRVITYTWKQFYHHGRKTWNV